MKAQSLPLGYEAAPVVSVYNMRTGQSVAYFGTPEDAVRLAHEQMTLKNFNSTVSGEWRRHPLEVNNFSVSCMDWVARR